MTLCISVVCVYYTYGKYDILISLLINGRAQHIILGNNIVGRYILAQNNYYKLRISIRTHTIVHFIN